MKRIFTLFTFLIFLFATQKAGLASDQEPAHVGAAICKTCHQPHFGSWSQTRMSKAFDLLKTGVRVQAKKKAGWDDVDYTKEEFCLMCHTTGFGEPGGFVSLEKTPHMVGIQCESCHGAGEKYAKMMLKARGTHTRQDFIEKGGLVLPTEQNNVCTDSCHNETSPFVTADSKFNFQDRKAMGTHNHSLSYISVPFKMF